MSVVRHDVGDLEAAVADAGRGRDGQPLPEGRRGECVGALKLIAYGGSGPVENGAVRSGVRDVKHRPATAAGHVKAVAALTGGRLALAYDHDKARLGGDLEGVAVRGAAGQTVAEVGQIVLANVAGVEGVRVSGTAEVAGVVGVHDRMNGGRGVGAMQQLNSS